jgi:hypothetical protein
MKKNILKGLFILTAGLILSLIICLTFFFLLPIQGMSLYEHIYTFYFFLIRTAAVSVIVGVICLIPLFLMFKIYKKYFNN